MPAGMTGAAGASGSRDRRTVMAEERANPSPRFFYGWRMMLVLAWGQLNAWGILYFAFPVFITPMHETLGWAQPEITAAFSLALFCTGLTGIPVGRILDRHGPRWVMTIGAGLGALLVFAWSRVETLPALYVVWAGIGAVMAMVLFEPAFAAIATWFYRYRSRALTVVTFVAGFATIIYVPLASALVTRYGWRTALVILAGILAVATIPLNALVLRRRPADLGLLPDGEPAAPANVPAANHRAEVSVSARVALRSRSFRWLTIAFCLTYLANVSMIVYFIPVLIAFGFSPGFAASAAAAIGIMALPGRLFLTPLGGRVPRRFIACVIGLMQAAAFVALVLSPTVVGVVLYVILFGAGLGAINPARAALVGELYGAREFGTISGVLAFFVTMARAGGPLLAGVVLSASGGYPPVLWLLAAVSAAGAGMALLITPEPH